jgi:hypothetical protein
MSTDTARPDCERCRRTLRLLSDLVHAWDMGFPTSAGFKADSMTTLLIVDLAALVRRAREALEGGQ